MLIVAALRVVGARKIFEFGTFMGANTLNMAMNTPPDAKIFTLDLGEECETEQHSSDAPLSRAHLASKTMLDFHGSAVEGKIKTLSGNSQSYDFSSWKGSMDFIFIDGGHDLATLSADTGNAFEMAGNPSCTMWHDYGNREYPELTRYLDRIAVDREIFHIEDTMLCAWFNDSERLLPLKLGQH